MVRLTLFWCRIKLQKSFIHEFIYFHYCCFISTSVTIIWGTEDCYYVFVVAPIEAIHNQLMCPTYKFETICLIELLTYILAKTIAGTTR